MATTYSQRPSALMGETDPYVAWCIDEAVLWAGTVNDPEDTKPVLEGGD